MKEETAEAAHVGQAFEAPVLARETKLTSVFLTRVSAQERARRTLSFDTLYDDGAPLVARWAVRLGGPNIDAADVVQEVFIVAHRKFHTLRPEIKPSTWLFGITRRVVLAQRRKQRRWLWLAKGSFESAELVPFSGPTPVQQLEQRRALADAYRVLERMREKHRVAFVLFELEGHSVQEVAELCDAKLNTVKVWLHRARAEFVKLSSETATRAQ